MGGRGVYDIWDLRLHEVGGTQYISVDGGSARDFAVGYLHCLR